MSAREYEEWRDARSWDPSHETELVIATDLAPAAWIEPLLLDRCPEGLARTPASSFSSRGKTRQSGASEWPKP
jgi:hypothetical protein